MSELAIELRNVSRCFGKTIANDKVSLKVRKGTVHAVVGENGAGKSTLMKIAYGQIRADEGEVFLKGTQMPRTKHSPMLAIDRGVGMVHQHFMLVPPLSVVENIVLGREPTRHGILDLARASQELRVLSKKYGLAVDPTAIVEKLSVGEQQRAEILKVLWQGCDILILDEPTAVLTPLEVEQLFTVLRELVSEGVSVVMITHKLDEVVAIADDITVMRRGKVVDHIDGKGASVASIAQSMVGRSVLLQVDKSAASPGQLVLEVGGLSATSNAGLPALKGVSFELAAGEILGVAGVEGNGQSELQECIVGVRKPTSGMLKLSGQDIGGLSVAQRYSRGMAHIPEDRHARAIVLEYSIEENLILGRHHDAKFSGRVVMHQEACRKEALARIKEVDIRPDDPTAIAGEMSGGNQQKIVIARELNRLGTTLLVCAQPTQGVDIGAIELIHKQVIAARDAGLAVLLFSAELSELQSLSDRLIVLYGGEVALRLDSGELSAPDARAQIGAAMTGASSNKADAS
ncbi:MAG: ABC transporter ATP-binding protein [Kofleriaceae bacterium]|nr:ABC transporter ATP-binding protein [Kofleriaceae bacterium]